MRKLKFFFITFFLLFLFAFVTAQENFLLQSPESITNEELDGWPEEFCGCFSSVFFDDSCVRFFYKDGESGFSILAGERLFSELPDELKENFEWGGDLGDQHEYVDLCWSGG